MSVVYQEELGNEDLTEPGHYRTTAFITNKFINSCARTVADFDPSRKDGSGNRYTTATGTGERGKLLLWGRPWFSGARSEPNYPSTEPGQFYSAHVIEPWTTVRGDSVDVYWVVSTWNPYQVVLMKSELRATP